VSYEAEPTGMWTFEYDLNQTLPWTEQPAWRSPRGCNFLSTKRTCKVREKSGWGFSQYNNAIVSRSSSRRFCHVDILVLEASRSVWGLLSGMIFLASVASRCFKERTLSRQVRPSPARQPRKTGWLQAEQPTQHSKSASNSESVRARKCLPADLFA
jgi:hypothetical protein